MGPIQLIPKRDMPRSPDRADTVAMLYYDMPSAEEYRERREQIERALSRTMGPEGDRWPREENQEYGGSGLWG